MPQKKIPLRKCTGCGESKPKTELVRVVKTPQGEVLPDLTGKLNGRGAYICKNPECLRKARKQKRFERAFEIPIPDSIYDAIEKELTDLGS